MNERYVSTTMPTGLTVKEALDRISQYVPASFVWIEIPEDIVVDLSDPTSCDMITGPGDYTIYKYTNGPKDVQVTPLNVNIRQSASGAGMTIFAFDGLNSFIKEYGGSWSEAIMDDPTELSIYRGSDEPSETDNYWLDTSHVNDADPYIDLKYYDGTQWVSIFASIEDIMSKSVYDTKNQKKDAFKYITDLLTQALVDTGEYVRHKKNGLALIHLTSDKRNKYNTTLLTTVEVQDLITTTYKSQLKNAVTSKLESETHTVEVQTKIDQGNAKWTEHLSDHITEEDVDKWDAKVGVHDHVNSPDVKIIPQDIITGVFPMSQIPDEVKERYYEITSLSEFGDSTITDAHRKGKYHKGNAFYMKTTNADGEEVIRWFRIMDPTKIGTANYMDGILEFTNEQPELVWSNLSNKPTTLAGYHLDDEAYTKTQVDAQFSPKITEYERLSEVYDNWANSIQLGCAFNSEITGGTFVYKRLGYQVKLASTASSAYNDMLEGSVFDIIFLVSVNGVDKIYKTGTIVDSLNNLLIAPGFSFVEIPLDGITASEYFTARFAANYTTDASNPNYTSSGCGYSVTTMSSTIYRLIEGVNVSGYPVDFAIQNGGSGLGFFHSPLVKLTSIKNIKAQATAKLDELESLANDVYLKWGYPGTATDFEGKQIDGTVPVTVSEAIESIVEMPELT